MKLYGQLDVQIAKVGMVCPPFAPKLLKYQCKVLREGGRCKRWGEEGRARKEEKKEEKKSADPDQPVDCCLNAGHSQAEQGG